MSRLEGDLDAMSVRDVAIWLANRAMSGELVLEHDTIEKRFLIQDGALVRASSSDARERFGQFLVHYGLLTEDQLRRAFDTQGATNVLLGRILVMIGLVAENQVLQVLHVKMLESMLDVFRWERGRFAFDTMVPKDERPEVELGIPLLDIHREATRRASLWQAILELFPSGATGLSVDETRIPQALAVDTLDGRIIALARRGCTLQDLRAGLRVTDYLLMFRLYELQQGGVIHPRAPMWAGRSTNGGSLAWGPTSSESPSSAIAMPSTGGMIDHVALGSGDMERAILAAVEREDASSHAHGLDMPIMVQGEIEAESWPGSVAIDGRSGLGGFGTPLPSLSATQSARAAPSAIVKTAHRGMDSIDGAPDDEALPAELIEEEALPSRDSVPCLIRPVDPDAHQRMTPKQRYLLARIDGQRSVQAIIQVSPMDDAEAMQIIQSFAEQGFVRL